MKISNCVCEFTVVAFGSYKKKDTDEVVNTLALANDNNIIQGCRIDFPFKAELYKTYKFVCDISAGTYQGKSFESVVIKGVLKDVK